MKSDDLSASSSSSIGIAEESSASLGSSGEDGEVESKMRRDSLGSMNSLEDSLPIKRGLSDFFKGKSKSFASLSDVVAAPFTAGDLAKLENPFNKRRRILMTVKSRRASCDSLCTIGSLPPSQPQLNFSSSSSSGNLFSLIEDDEEEEQPKKGEESSTSPTSLVPSTSTCSVSSLSSLSSSSSSSKGVRNSKKVSFRSPRSFSLGDLQQHAHQFT